MEPPSSPGSLARVGPPLAAAAFENAYGGVPTWDIGRPQKAVVELARDGAIGRTVLDVGCGTGENALHLAALGHEVTAIDFAPTAVAKARAKAAERGLDVRFEVFDALELGDFDGAFDTALDIGLFHCLQPADRQAYTSGLRGIVRPAGTTLLLCWSDRNPFGRGPERISRRDIRRAFADGWRVEAIEPATLETSLPEGGVAAWLASLTRL